MAVDYSVTALLEDVRARAMLPDAGAFSDADLCLFANGEVKTYILPMLLRTNEEYLVTSADQSTVVDQEGYDIPEDAVGNKIRDIQILQGTTYRSLSRIEPEHQDLSSTDSGDPWAFTFRGAKVILVPAPSTVTTLRIYYFARPPALTANFTTYVSKSTPNVTLVSTTDFGIVADDVTLDFRSTAYPFPLQAEDVDGTISSTTVVALDTFTDVASVTAGAYVCEAGYSPVVVGIPLDVLPVLAQRVAFKCLRSLGDPRAGEVRKECDEMRDEAIKLLTPRSEGRGRKVINFNAPGWR